MAKVTTVRLDDELSERVDALADAMDRPKSWVIEQAISSYVTEQSWQVQQIKEALADYETGHANLVSHEDVVADLKELEAEINSNMKA